VARRRTRKFEVREFLIQRVVDQQAPAQGFADTCDQLDHFQCLQATDYAAQSADDARLSAIGHGASGWWLGKQATITRRPVIGIEHGDLPLELINTAVYEWPAREGGGIVVEVARGKRVGPVDDDIVSFEEIEGVSGGDSFVVLDDANKGIGLAEARGGGGDLGSADGGVVVEKLPLEIVGFNAVEVGNAERAYACGSEVKRGGATESARADDEHARGGEFLLAGEPDLGKHEVPTVARKFGGGKGRRGGGHKPKRVGRGQVAIEIAPGVWAGRTCGMRFIGIDYGTRRLGLAYGDELGVATPLPAQVELEPERRWAGLMAMVKARRATDLVLGYPLNMDGTTGFKAKEVDAFAARLRVELGLPVHLVDETLTSHEAESTIAKGRRREIRASGIVDSRAATLILQDYLDQKFPQNPPDESR